ncbi:MAG: UDP-N-acetylmuramoyl-L-alanine--D-glutamate ligase [Clostridiales bacterium]|nr:UDP-N-acetylmuramoyl-L-alanine--D-glutamate ligase [Clostridiales bacterium]
MNRKLNDLIKSMDGKSAAVIGVGISNIPLIRWLYGLNVRVTAFDRLPEDDPAIVKAKADFEKDGIVIDWSLGKDYLDRLMSEAFDYVFKTPKMRYTSPELVAAKNNGSILTSEMELFMNLCPAKIFAVTGSDGKTTTTTLISELLKEEGYKVWTGGNIGTPLLDKISEISDEDMVVLELSSFQLLDSVTSADVAVLTNVTPNHLDFHKDYNEYIDAKTNIFKYQSPMGRVVLNSACDITYKMKDMARGEVSYFALDESVAKRSGSSKLKTSAYLNEEGYLTIDGPEGNLRLIREEEILIPGRHNVENYLAAALAVRGFVGKDAFVKVAKTFKGVAHRIEFIRELDGVKYYNSSIDTSPNRTINTMNALASRGQRGVLICGGADKKCDYTGLGDAILKVCDRIIIYGSNAVFIKSILEQEASGRAYEVIELESKEGDVYEFPETREAVLNRFVEALDIAREKAREGEIVILSSVGTSYDHFRHFEHRGDMFRDLVNGLN